MAIPLSIRTAGKLIIKIGAFPRTSLFCSFFLLRVCGFANLDTKNFIQKSANL